MIMLKCRNLVITDPLADKGSFRIGNNYVQFVKIFGKLQAVQHLHSRLNVLSYFLFAYF